MSDASEVTLYDRIGGDQAVAQLLVSFYERVLADPELSPFFVDLPIQKLRNMQQEFFAAALDGPVGYTGRPLTEVHAGMGIRPKHLRRFLEHLLATLEGMGLDEDDRYDVYSRIAMRADEVTGVTTVDG
jgi:hemoglobin